MDDYTKLILRNVPPSYWNLATRVAQQSEPDIEEFGFRKGIVYEVDSKKFYVYKTKTSFVVLGLFNENSNS